MFLFSLVFERTLRFQYRNNEFIRRINWIFSNNLLDVVNILFGIKKTTVNIKSYYILCSKDKICYWMYLISKSSKVCLPFNQQISHVSNSSLFVINIHLFNNAPVFRPWLGCLGHDLTFTLLLLVTLHCYAPRPPLYSNFILTTPVIRGSKNPTASRHLGIIGKY